MRSLDALFRSSVICLLMLAGCSGGAPVPKLNSVTGRVTLDGEPLAEAIVSFIPDKGPPSGAITDDEGKYVLKFKTGDVGAVAGEHTVTISTDLEGTNRPEDERVPEQYNKQTTLRVTVTEGQNEHDFDLHSK
jgi:hypothetical protein